MNSPSLHANRRRRHGRIPALFTTALVSMFASPAFAGDLVPLTGVRALDAGAYYTCAVAPGGAAKCWGDNRYGQLGDDSTQNRHIPVDVISLGSGVLTISGGLFHTCALTSAGAVKCWGRNAEGQLGDGTTAQRLTPGDVAGLGGGVRAISAGTRHTCALTSAGVVKCWGDNRYGKLGDGTYLQRLTPVDVVGLDGGVQTIAAGNDHTCAVVAGAVKCWGRNAEGQLGDGNGGDKHADSPTPVDVVGLGSGAQTITVGGTHSCALANGAARCWGDNHKGQLGDGTTTRRLTPVDVAGLSSHVQAIDAGLFHTCALTQAGGVRCWGGNSFGQLGDNTTTDRLTPVNVVGLASGVRAISAGFLHTCAVATDDGAAKCWGDNWYGELGDGTNTNRLTPVGVLVPPPPDPIFANGFEVP